MIEFQTQLVFPTHAVGAPGPLPRGAALVTMPTPDGHVLHGVHVPPSARPSGAKTLVLGFAGNAWNSADAATYLHRLYPETDVIVFHYRGYRPSTGRPSAKALLADAPLVHDFAKGRVDAEKTVAVGFSIGSGVAAHLASQRPIDGLILVTPFDSLKAVASGFYPMLPVGLFFTHEIDTASALKGLDVPTAVIAGANDTLIPPVRTDALRRVIRNLVHDRTLRGAGHNDIYHRTDFQTEMRQALAAVTK